MCILQDEQLTQSKYLNFCPPWNLLMSPIEVRDLVKAFKEVYCYYFRRSPNQIAYFLAKQRVVRIDLFLGISLNEYGRYALFELQCFYFSYPFSCFYVRYNFFCLSEMKVSEFLYFFNNLFIFFFVVIINYVIC